MDNLQVFAPGVGTENSVQKEEPAASGSDSAAQPPRAADPGDSGSGRPVFRRDRIAEAPVLARPAPRGCVATASSHVALLCVSTSTGAGRIPAPHAGHSSVSEP